MLACWSMLTARASRRKRSRPSALSERLLVMTLTATILPSTLSRALYTTPIPPRPIRSTISYLPIRAGIGISALLEIEVYSGVAQQASGRNCRERIRVNDLLVPLVARRFRPPRLTNH